MSELDLSACDPEPLTDDDLYLMVDLIQKASLYTPDDDPPPHPTDWQNNFTQNLVNLKKMNFVGNRLTESEEGGFLVDINL